MCKFCHYFVRNLCRYFVIILSFSSLFVIICHYLSVLHCHYFVIILSLFCHYLSLFVIRLFPLSLFVIICHYFVGIFAPCLKCLIDRDFFLLFYHSPVVLFAFYNFPHNSWSFFYLFCIFLYFFFRNLS